jgi:hypothetical protein
MDITLLIIRKRRPRHVGWTLGFCYSCGGFEGVRIDDEIEVTSVWFVPVSRTVVGTWTRCDFCDRPTNDLVTSARLGPEEWVPAEGQEALASRLKVEATDLRLEPDRETRLRSLLSAVEESTSLSNLDVSLGITSGMILGGLLGLLVGILIIPRFDTGLDRLGAAFAGILGGLTLGAVLGGMVAVLVGQRLVPPRRIRRVLDRYDIPISALEGHAEASGPRTRRAIARLSNDMESRSSTRGSISLQKP